MEINQVLNFLESFRNLGIVRFVASFYREGILKPITQWVTRVAQTPGRTAVVLLVLAIVLIVAVFVVDQIMYFTVPGRVDEWRVKTYQLLQRARRFWRDLTMRIRAGKRA
ncbi:MAG: hypothetical protein PHD32_08930 [Eubacteriales bacterium]|nr:hypothetical protein [Eubacteriales bacterium]